MKGRITVLSGAIIAFSATAALADLPWPTCVAPAPVFSSDCRGPDVHTPADESAATPHSNTWDGFAGGLPGTSPQPFVPPPPPQRTGPEVTDLPAGPGSFSLVLAAFGSLGAWRLGRSTRKLHFSSVPEWFHTGGPEKIGHVSMIDLDGPLSRPHTICDQSPRQFSASALPFPPARCPIPRLRAQCFLISVETRGPPSLHL